MIAPALLALGLHALGAAGPVVYSQDFTQHDPSTGLPAGWGKGPPAHEPYFESSPDREVFGDRTPSLRVDLPPHTLNYRISSPGIPIRSLAEPYTLEASLRIEQPDSPFLVLAVFHDRDGNKVGEQSILDLPGEQMDAFRTFRSSFVGAPIEAEGTVTFLFGLPYTKCFREGRFWIDDVRLRTGADAGPLDFYLRPRSIAAGEEVLVHVSSAEGMADLQVWREESEAIPIAGPFHLEDLALQPIPDQVWERGCGWPTTLRLQTGTDWPSGLYTVRLRDRNRSVTSYFVVRGRGTEGRLLVVLPTHTEEAYNGWGGGSFYTRIPRPVVSFERPAINTVIGPYFVSIHLLRWLAREGIPFAVACDDDLNDRPELLSHYAGIAIPGHSEYWSRPMRRNLEDYVALGGSLLCLSGNTCWWQTRVQPGTQATDDVPGGGRQLVCYKYRAPEDPMLAADPALVTTRWDEAPVLEPATRLLGLSWREGGTVNGSTSSACPCPYDWLTGHGGFEAFHTDHWVFENTGLREGDTFGREDAIVGYEVDGAPIRWDGGMPTIDPAGGTSERFVVLGYAPAWNDLRQDSSGVALAVIAEDGDSFVFNGGTLGWCWGLPRDPIVQQITRNLCDRLTRAPASSPLAESFDAYPNPAGQEVSFRMKGRAAPAQASVWSATGRRVASVDLTRYGIDGATARWNLRDEGGKTLPAGVYWAGVPGLPRVRIVHVR